MNQLVCSSRIWLARCVRLQHRGRWSGVGGPPSPRPPEAFPLHAGTVCGGPRDGPCGTRQITGPQPCGKHTLHFIKLQKYFIENVIDIISSESIIYKHRRKKKITRESLNNSLKTYIYIYNFKIHREYHKYPFWVRYYFHSK